MITIEFSEFSQEVPPLPTQIDTTTTEALVVQKPGLVPGSETRGVQALYIGGGLGILMAASMAFAKRSKH